MKICVCCKNGQKASQGEVTPLVKSPSEEALRKNVKAEVTAGKPQKQAVAIAYSVECEAAGKPDVKSKK